jgi:hypothetical protein
MTRTIGIMIVVLAMCGTSQAEDKPAGHSTELEASVKAPSDQPTGRHPFILSGQSNMYHLKPDASFIVSGRLSDCGGEKWTKFREAQVKYAEDRPYCEWVDTDDLNDSVKNGKAVNGLRYTKEGYAILGQRFAEKAIALIEKK